MPRLASSAHRARNAGTVGDIDDDLVASHGPIVRHECSPGPALDHAAVGRELKRSVEPPAESCPEASLGLEPAARSAPWSVWRWPQARRRLRYRTSRWELRARCPRTRSTP